MLSRKTPRESTPHIWVVLPITLLLGCNTHSQIDSPIETKTQSLSIEQSTRQIQLIAEIGDFEVMIGQDMGVYSELFSLADQIRSRDGKIFAYDFFRLGAGGNDDGTDTLFVCFVEGEKIIYYIDEVMYH